MNPRAGKTSLSQAHRDPNARTPSFYFPQGLSRVDGHLIQELKQSALEEGMARICLHASPHDRHHDMIIVARRESGFRPHRHPGKDETVHVIQGQMGLIHYTDSGAVLKTETLGPGDLVRLPAGHWHCTLPLSDFVVYHESAPGPYVSGRDTVIADWFSESSSLDFKTAAFGLFPEMGSE